MSVPPRGLAAPDPEMRRAIGAATGLPSADDLRALRGHLLLKQQPSYRRTGKREHLTAAATMYREIDIRFWLEQAGGGDEGLA
jgi:hypothetical protein